MAASLHAIIDAFIGATRHAGLDYRFLLDAYDRVPFLQGIAVSVELVVATMAGSALAGLGLLLALRHRNPWLAGAARAFVELTRN
ncbi:MAG TPA: amino acid ABC transporter permease, partial [Paraburkholderia sp.]|nr:amino acid ABC transporter permease [Paraburkholderia sp.]